MQCLENIIGLSRRNCDCFQEDRPTDYNVSKSGIYLDELEGLSIRGVDTSVDCGDASPWSLMTNAISNGILRFKTDLLSAVRQRFKERFTEFDGIIGLRVFNDAMPSNQLGALNGIKIDSNCIKGSMFILKKIDAFFDTDLVDLPVKIYQTGSNTPVAEFTIDATANVRHTNTLDPVVELPLWIDGYDEFAYYIVYDLPLGVAPLNNKLHGCSPCMGKAKFASMNPWHQWIEIGGIASPLYVSTDLLDMIGTNSYGYGLNLHANVICKKSSMICDDNDDFDFENDEIALHIAYSIRLAAGISLFNLILQRPDSAYVAINEEQINFLISQYSEDYKNRLQYLAINIQPNSDCYTCGDQMAVGNILA